MGTMPLSSNDYSKAKTMDKSIDKAEIYSPVIGRQMVYSKGEPNAHGYRDHSNNSRDIGLFIVMTLSSLVSGLTQAD